MDLKITGIKNIILENAKKHAHFILFPASIFFMELVVKIYCFGALFDRGFIYLFAFSVPIGLAAALLGSLFSKRVNRIVSAALMFFITFLLGIQVVYYGIFKAFFTIYSLIGAGEVLRGFGAEVFSGIVRSILPLMIIFLPFLAVVIWGERFAPERPGKKLLFGLLAAAVILQLTGRIIVKRNNVGIMPDEYVYSETFSPALSVPNFGVLTTFRLDIKNTLSYKEEIFPDEQPPEIETPVLLPPPAPPAPDGQPDGQHEQEEEFVHPGYNMLEIDFEGLIEAEGNQDIADMHRYFSSLEPTSKNQYTGMFEGYNLIWIVAEGFNSLALDETHTPTLSRLAGEGFVFNNFYNPLWGVSTSDGEYVATTGLLPKPGIWSYYRSSYNHMPFGFGNMFSRLGYSARAYHGHTYTYYKRNLSYPNMGYAYKGVGNGLDITKQWPASDIEVIEATVPEFIEDAKFHVYYMTISGHLNYNFRGNMMAAKHKNEVDDLPYSEAGRAYIATQMEFDQSVSLLIERLAQAGVLENTVIVISGDHYPYGLDIEQMEELQGAKIEPDFELYRSTLIIWNPAMEPVTVDKYCSSLDIMPTLANLFGLKYDSRLVIGTDILSDSKPLVIFNNRSFITEKGRYNSKTNTFTPSRGAETDDDYPKVMFEEVSEKFRYSAMILEKDYYGLLFAKEG